MPKASLTTEPSKVRCLLHRSAAAFAVLAVVTLGGWPSTADETPRPKIRVRRDIMSLAPDGPEMAALRKAVKVMKGRPATDPTSWTFQANIHATLDKSNPAWNQCQHGNYFFLPWHRMYAYWFERIVREASGDPDFVLPYWNYVNPAARALPEAFRVPADASNPLFVAERNADGGGVNNGARLPAAVAASYWLPFRLTNFATTSPTGAAFGGRVVDKPVHLMSTMGAFETYHNAMHVLIGGESGFMSDPFGSARDPVFWPHHVNVDRLWKRWLDQGGGRANPLNDRAWMDMKFPFFDEKGRKVEMSVRECLNTEELGYRYDDDPSSAAEPRPGPIAAQAGPLKKLAVSKVPGELGTDGPVRVTMDLGDEAQAAVRKDGNLVLFVEGIKFEKEPMVIYEVYLNLPAKEPADFQSVHFVGNLVFAGLDPRAFMAHHGIKKKGQKKEADETYLSSLRAFDVTDVVRELRARKLWQDQQLTVTFVMNGLVPVKGRPVTSAGVKAQFERVTLLGN